MRFKCLTVWFFSISFLLFLYAGLLAQPQGVAVNIPVTNVDNLVQGRLYVPKYEGIKGSQYLNENWQLGNIVVLDQMYEGLPLYYDVFLDAVIYVRRQPNTFDFIRLNEGYIKAFTLEDRTFLNLAYSSYASTTLEPGFYELIEAGPISLLVKRFLKIQPDNGEAYFLRRDAYYLVKENEIKRLRSKKDIYSFSLETDKKAIQKMLKEQNFSYKTATDQQWKSIIQFLNTLEKKNL